MTRHRGSDSLRQRAGRIVGPILAVALLLLPPPPGLEPAGWRTAAVGVLMAIWWLSEAIPIPATSLLPLALLPLFGAGSIQQVAAPYGNPVIFLFLGGFLLALGMQRWGLHRRIALAILSRAGGSYRALVGGFMAGTAFLSLWVSNTATTMMMLPIGISVIALLEREGSDDRREDGDEGRSDATDNGFSTALLLGIAYAASIGGLGTLIGTPPNAFLAGFVSEVYGIELGFARWLLIGLPVVLIGLPVAWLVLTRVAFRVSARSTVAGHRLLRRERDALGLLSAPERRVAIVSVATACLWVLRPALDHWLPGLTDAGIAVAAGLSLFVIPAGKGRTGGILDWEWASRLPWDLLLLFGGGLSLAAAIDRTGLNGWLGQAAAATAEWPLLLFILLITAVVVFLTELTSNTATAAAFLPIVGAVAVRAGWDPLLLTVPAALAASCAFMLPVATPPNAIVYGSHRVSVPEMARAGWWLNLLMIALVTGIASVLVPLVFGTSG